nr:GH1 family beta-glucosidase [Bailinhaonella thermotolerans]
MLPTGFTLGAATSAYQVEGAVSADGRGRSIWDTFADTPGKVVGGDTGEVASDHYHRYREDVRLMAELGLTAYRFSVAWPRIVPAGSGAVNEAGLDFYRRLVDALLEAGIEPWITLYHWDLPQPLEDAGGWPNRDTAYRFAEFADVVHGALGDRVSNWITVNEPWCAAFVGYASGEHAPGRREPRAAVHAAHHLMLGHGLAAQAIRARSASARIGVGLNFYPVAPASDSEADRDAARRIDGLQNRFFADAVLRGAYPADVLEDLSAVTAPEEFIREGDLATISVPIDTLCINYYSRYRVSGTPGTGKENASAAPTGAGSPWVGSEHVSFLSNDLPVTNMNWEIDETGLSEILVRLARDYPGVELAVTENGAAFDDEVSPDGEVHDGERLAYLDAHLRACRDVVEQGVPLIGYFAWTFLDNFEWAWGYGKRFGLVYVDFATQRRIPKDSARWYAEVIKARRAPAE